MKKWIVFISAVLWLTLPAFAKDLELRKKAGEYDVEIKIDRNPPVLGDNNMEIKIRDAGAPLSRTQRSS